MSSRFPAGTTKAVADAIVDFFFLRHESNRPTFYADDLRRFVAQRLTVAPGTPDRILRAMRKAGKINYSVTDRAKSLYQILPLTHYVDGTAVV